LSDEQDTALVEAVDGFLRDATDAEGIGADP